MTISFSHLSCAFGFAALCLTPLTLQAGETARSTPAPAPVEASSTGGSSNASGSVPSQPVKEQGVSVKWPDVLVPPVTLEFVESQKQDELEVIERGLSASLVDNIMGQLSHMGANAKITHKPSSGQPVPASLEIFHGLIAKREFLEGLLQCLDKVAHGRITMSPDFVQIQGSVESDKDKALIVNTLTSLLPEGYNLESVLKVEIPVLSPYPLTLLKSTDKRVHVSGAIPSAAVRERLMQSIQGLYGGASYVSSTLRIAAGMPTDRWPMFVQQSLPLLTFMNEGSLEIRDKVLTVKGVTENPVQILNRITMLRTLYPAYQVNFVPQSQQIVARPYRMHIQKSPTQVIQLQGVMPNQEAYEDLKKIIKDKLPDAKLSEQITYADGMPDGNWLKALQQSITALLPLTSGSIQLEDRTLTVTAGAKTRGQRDRAASTLTQTSFPAYQQTLTLIDRPTLLTLEKQNYQQRRLGKAPSPTNRQSTCLKELEESVQNVPFEWVTPEATFLDKNQAALWTLGEALSHCRGVRLVAQMDVPRTQRRYYQNVIFQGLAKMGTDMSHLIIHSGTAEKPMLSFRTF